MDAPSWREELRRSAVALLFEAGFFGRRLLRLALRLEGGVMFSYSLRLYLSKKHDVTLGSYSYGRLDDLLAFPTGTSIGRYTSIGPGVRAFQANHPFTFISQHPFLYRADAHGFVSEERIARKRLEIGHDVWIGANTIICPGCQRVGTGAVVGAGSVVTKDIPDYAIAAGNPARILRPRFPERICQSIAEARWWNHPCSRIEAVADLIAVPLTDDNVSSLLEHFK